MGLVDVRQSVACADAHACPAVPGREMGRYLSKKGTFHFSTTGGFVDVIILFLRRADELVQLAYKYDDALRCMSSRVALLRFD